MVRNVKRESKIIAEDKEFRYSDERIILKCAIEFFASQKVSENNPNDSSFLI